MPIGTTLVELGPVPTELLAGADDYTPTAKAFQRFYRLQLSAAVPREKVAAEVKGFYRDQGLKVPPGHSPLYCPSEVVRAVERGRRHVRLPRRAAVSAMLVEAPRRITEFALKGVPHR